MTSPHLFGVQCNLAIYKLVSFLPIAVPFRQSASVVLTNSDLEIQNRGCLQSHR